MKTIDILKKAVTTVVGIGTAKIIREVIKNNVETDHITSKVTVVAASAVIGSAVSELTKQYTDHQIDEMIALFEKFKNRTNSRNEKD